MQLLYLYFQLLNFTLYTVTLNAAGQFTLSTVNVSAESVDGPTPAARVTWSTTVPPECVVSVRVEFRTSRTGPVVATNTTTNTSQTAVIQTGLQCTTNYYITVVVTGATSTVSSRPVQVLVGGKRLCTYTNDKLHLCYKITSCMWCAPSWKAKRLS